MEFRVIPAVLLEGHLSRGVPASAVAIGQYAPTIRGVINGFPFDAMGQIDADGNFVIKVPRGLDEAVVQLHTMRTSASSGNRTATGRGGRGGTQAITMAEPQWRVEKYKPLVTGAEIPIGQVGDGVRGIEVVYPDALQSGAPAGRGRSTARGGL